MKYLLGVIFLLIPFGLSAQKYLAVIRAERGRYGYKIERHLVDLENSLSNVCKHIAPAVNKRDMFISAEQWRLNNDSEGHKKNLLLQNNLMGAIEIAVETNNSLIRIDLNLHKLYETRITTTKISVFNLDFTKNESISEFTKWITGLNEEARLCLDGKIKRQLDVIKFDLHSDLRESQMCNEFAVNIPRTLSDKFRETQLHGFRATYCIKNTQTNWHVMGKILSEDSTKITIDIRVWGYKNGKSASTLLFAAKTHEYAYNPVINYEISASNLARLISNSIKKSTLTK